jgi:hypothetical protein
MHYSATRIVRTLVLPLVSTLAFIGTAAAATPTVISTAHYQHWVQFSNCDGSSSSCGGDFPLPGYKRQLNLTRITCHVTAPQAGIYSNAYITLQNAANQAVAFEFLPPDYSATTGGYTQYLLNRAIDLQVGGSQHIHVTFNVSGGNPVFGLCKVSGTIDTLQ